MKVPTITLDQYLAERSIRGIDVMKMDIEGAELLALRGARALLAGEKAPVLVLEVNPRTLALSGNSAEGLLGLLEEFGYAYRPIATYGTHTHDPWTNGIAAKPVHLDRFPALKRLFPSFATDGGRDGLLPGCGDAYFLTKTVKRK